jgi:hypothetical protein
MQNYQTPQWVQVVDVVGLLQERFGNVNPHFLDVGHEFDYASENDVETLCVGKVSMAVSRPSHLFASPRLEAQLNFVDVFQICFANRAQQGICPDRVFQMKRAFSVEVG